MSKEVQEHCKTCKKNLKREIYTSCEYSGEMTSFDGVYYFNRCRYVGKYEKKEGN